MRVHPNGRLCTRPEDIPTVCDVWDRLLALRPSVGLLLMSGRQVPVRRMRGHVTEGRRSLEEGKYVEGDRLGTLIGNGKVPERLVRAVYLKGAFDADVLVGPVWNIIPIT